ncbi:MAG: signal recognition particle-docking protein FtsY [Alphaproteobacteria bacterium 65-7]|nr:MAG: signal recognition particle-docking protein FtsY [Alphaproteobacteria bacterium 65-7]
MRTFGEAPPPPSFFERLTTSLSKTGLGAVLTRRKLDADTIAELEEALVKADMGGAQAKTIAAAVAKGRYDAEISASELKDVLAREIAALLAPVEKPLLLDDSRKPFVILVAGVNGSGKTTTIGKMAKRLAESGAKVTLAAGDTFRAAAIEQLRVWADRAKAGFVATKTGGDAAGLAFEGLEKARANGSDVLLIDTAGRLQNKAGLMAELEKIARVLKKLDTDAPHAVLLVLDATTGQNALSQVEAFGASVPLTGLVMTKLDGTAKGGILVALAARFGLPVHYIGVGEGEDDLQPFRAQGFARALVGLEQAEGTS